ncbi:MULTISPECIES: formyltetrahydrofolate deformylase [unclassified Arthrobacter]|uniref:formyltetrahydrofolate deformylase n=1 Tax=unclassified Arthrobacter TaxID=235627 RepID=UPI00036E822F|nr:MULTISPECIES: formyltetrahydrofolate deformylase [unclassified Arthrobacter]BCW56296.1 formyltetrahydrofolate deformylase [Arthrobacter sp. StoSoilB19]BCW77400.1 formyltetrahydrofolate deformylase [Arthrobacter sp. NicSoilB11]
MTVTETRMPAPKAPTTVEHVLTLDCAEGPGIVHAVSGFLLEHGCDIIDNKQFGERSEGHFFMRVHFVSEGDESTLDTLRKSFAPVADKFGMRWQLERHGSKRRVLIMVSKFGHCLNDLLFRARIGELPVDVVAVVSNHRDHQALVEWHGIPFHHIPVTADTKPDAEARLMELVDGLEVELVVLARYMQVLSDDLTRKLDGRAINIHHSFLPSFKGAKPYHQAYARGVKTVGATAHYVNAELDEGPIIAQQVVEVDHTYGPEDLVAAGRDTECKALSNAVKWHCEGRVLLQGNRTVVLR